MHKRGPNRYPSWYIYIYYFFWVPQRRGLRSKRVIAYMGRKSTQVGKGPGHAGRKPAQVGREPAHVGRGGVPRVWTQGSQVRIVVPYHSVDMPFSNAYGRCTNAFSTMKFLKIAPCNKKEDEFLINYLIVHIEKEIIEKSSIKIIIDDFKSMKECRALSFIIEIFNFV